jgi:Flp pilus assembly protein TadG
VTGPIVGPPQRFERAQNGQALVEFALFASLFVMIMVGVSDLSFYLISAMAVQEAATEGAAYGASPRNQNDNSGMVTWANQAASDVTLAAVPTSQTFYTCSPGGAHVASSAVCIGGVAPMEYVSVTATANVNPLFRAPFLSSGPISSTAVYRVAWKTQ